MADFSSRIMTSAEHSAVTAGPAGKASSSSVGSGNGSWDGVGGLDQITVVRIDDTHIAEDKDAAVCYEVEYSMPAEDEVAGEEEEDGVYVIEYSNPEEEGESYQFTMSVDRSLPAKKPIINHPAARESARAPLPVMSKPVRPQRPRQKRKLEVKQLEVKQLEVKRQQEVKQLEVKQLEVKQLQEVKQQEVVSNKCVLELGEDYREVMGMNLGSDKKQLMCTLCPQPGRLFKRAAGLAVHLKHMHLLEAKKTFFCSSCQQSVRSQIELDAHTKRHANQDAVFTCLLCPAEMTGYKGSRWGLRRHLEKEHRGVIPRCDICNKGFTSLVSYLADQFRHVGVSPYYCARCQIYEMTERGLNVHMKNDSKKKKQESDESNLQAAGVSANADNSATDDSDF
ncbi:zinc finger protein 667-like isoform X2 [Cottoperca gobio]|uniref:Zinc finger protein 667-like isoform X2 n=1 Tax=Cottoperca gobio TaxID=56716 RepID=A0A6J2PAB4_COTGO|nr:zinc finger protein 667-like isoform X2 [Cottoperca gobio]